MMDVMYSFAFIGEIFGFTDGTAAGIGTAAVITFFVSIIALASTKNQTAKRTGQYTATQPDSPHARAHPHQLLVYLLHLTCRQLE
jgi:hypothetical protein